MSLMTVIAASNESPNSHASAIDRTAACLPFPCERILISNKSPKNYSGRIIPSPEWLPDARGEQHREVVSKLMLEFMPMQVETEFSLFVHWDGYAINPKLWTNIFLRYDYIGAPWPLSFNPNHPERRVGGGGFSLRSKKWLDACLTLPVKETSAEDVHCCCNHLEHFIAAGCKIAPLEVAAVFALEHVIPEFPNHTINDSFGFHSRAHFWSRPDLVEPAIG